MWGQTFTFKLSLFWLYVCMYVHVNVHVKANRAFAGLNAHMSVCKGWVSVIQFVFCGTGYHIGLELTSLARLAGLWVPWSPCFYLPSTGITNMCHYDQLLHMGSLDWCWVHTLAREALDWLSNPCFHTGSHTCHPHWPGAHCIVLIYH